MAQKRMIDKKISVSEQIANLSTKGQLFSTWGIPHADDVGLLPRSARTLKALIVPMNDDISTSDVEAIITEMMKNTVAKEFSYAGETYLQYTNFSKYQTLRKDRMPYTLFQLPDKIKNFKQAWRYLEDIGFQLEDTGDQMEPELNGREEKGIEVKRREENKQVFGEFKKVYLTQEQYERLVEKLGEKNTLILISELDSYIASTGAERKYKDHCATIQNWAKRKIEKHVESNKPKRTLA